jgi:DNA topoisomerase-2
MTNQSASHLKTRVIYPVQTMANLASKYKRLDHREHILQRPQMYIGSVELDTYKTWVSTANGFELKDTAYVPGLYKIFDEILVNAIDHVTRLKNDTSTKNQVRNIKVTIDQSNGVIEVWNDGDGIDIECHPEHNIYIPELIFGHLLTSANYNDAEEKTIGGQNGIGAKACNVFSKSFTVETVDAKRKKIYSQNFSDNMREKTQPIVKTCATKPFTCIKFLPDYARFGCKGLTDEMHAMLIKRVYDACAVTPNDVAVWMNGKKLEQKTFERYVDLYIGGKSAGEGANILRAYERLDERWEVVACGSQNGEFQQVSFVNGIWTMRGGKHVDYIVNQIIKKLGDVIAKKKKETVKPQLIKDNLFVFVKATISDPTFDSQTKDTLTTPVSKFGGGKPELSDKFIEKLYKSGLVDKVLALNNALKDKSMKKTDGKKRSIIRNLVKLEDANWAGTAKSHECTLILTEGDSAMTMAMSGIDEVGRDKYGVFPLKGKLLNVKDVAAKRIIENEEINNLKKIIGLETGKTYHDVSELRYGKVMALCDSDNDGSHIKGLLFNMFQTLWPSLFKLDGFLTTMLTPIVKVKKGSNNVVSFHTLTDYENWKKAQSNPKSWDIKYYKGLGTSTAEEARQYFRDLKTLEYVYTQDSDANIDLAFNKKRANDRKDWLATYDRQSILTFDKPTVSFDDFIHKDLIHFSNYDVRRSIPSLVDGLKVSQRKIMFACFAKKWSKECRVAQLSAFVSENSAYHHGEESLNNAIIGLAQNFVGSNNVNLLRPNGQFGSRIKGGKDSSSPRYIYTELEAITKSIFKKEDEAVLNYLDDDGLPVEPEFYTPVLPMVLVNGATGIGTGFSTSIPCYNPRDIIACLRSMLVGSESGELSVLDSLQPWYRGFRGTIVKQGDKLCSRGVYERQGATKIRVKELPIGMWTEEFKEMLESYLDTKPYLKAYDSHYTDVRVDFDLHFHSSEALDSLMAIEENGFTKLENEFKLVSTRGLGITNMYLFNENGQITKYKSVGEIIRAFYGVRMQYYQKRKDYLLNELDEKKVVLQAKIVFINEISEGTLFIHDQSKDSIEAQLREKSYPDRDGSYDYLVGMPIYNLTKERKAKLLEELDQVMEMYRQLSARSCESIWLDEIDEFEASFSKHLDQFEQSTSSTQPGTTGKTAKKKYLKKKPE